MFKTYFLGWDEVIAVDFTRTAESVARTGADLASWAKQQETKYVLRIQFIYVFLISKVVVNVLKLVIKLQKKNTLKYIFHTCF